MKKLLLAITALILAVSCGNGGKSENKCEKSLNTIKLKFVSLGDAKVLLGTEDKYIRDLSKFDIASITGNSEDTKDYIMQFISEQAMEWTPEEIQRYNAAADSLNQVILKNGYKIPLPAEIKIIKSTMDEAKGAGGYTRSDYIVMHSEFDDNATPRLLAEILAHETFHVLTRNCHDFRTEMYSAIGFDILENEIKTPENLKELTIRNPDVDRKDSYTMLNINGEKKRCSMLIHADEPYAGGELFNYLKISLLNIDENGNPVTDENGNPVMYSLDQASDFFEKVGKNTNYIIDPEEILADNFRFILSGNTKDLPSQDLVKKIETVLVK